MAGLAMAAGMVQAACAQADYPFRDTKLTDDQRIAGIVNTDAGTELRVLEAGQSGFLTILNPGKRPGSFGNVVWRRDSLHLLYTWSRKGGPPYFLTEQSATGSSEVRDFGEAPGWRLYSVAPDGTWLTMIAGSAGRTLYLVRLEGDRKPRPLSASDRRRPFREPRRLRTHPSPLPLYRRHRCRHRPPQRHDQPGQSAAFGPHRLRHSH